jgi:hypothetical protein
MTCETAPGDTYDERVEYIESTINMGQVEELLTQAANEETVVHCYYENKMWEGLGDGIVRYEQEFAAELDAKDAEAQK